MKNVLVFFGGESCEHDVSVITGVMTLNAVDKSKYNAIPVYVGKNGKWYTNKKMNDVSIFKNLKLKTLNEVVLLPSDRTLYALKNNRLKQICQVYAVINCCHGGEGENGGLSSIIRQSNLPCTSSSGFSSAVAMDKEFTKIVLNSLSICCLPCVRINRDNYYLRRDTALKLVKQKIGFPSIVKPSRLGSSIGIKVAYNEDDLERGLSVAFAYDDKVIVERALSDFREINCAVYKNGGEVICSECEEPFVNGDMLTFEDKYTTPSTKKFPADLDRSISDKIKETSKVIYKRLQFSGVIRIDFLLCEEQIYVNEINSVPGSLAYYLFCKNTEEFSDFLSQLIEESVDEHVTSCNNKTTFNGGVLNFSSSKIKG